MKPSLFVLAFFLLPLLCAQSQSVALNDEFATRIVLTGELPLSWAGSTSNLTLEPADGPLVTLNTDDFEIKGSMWFEWTAPQTGIYDFQVNELFGVVFFKAPPPAQPQVPASGQKVEPVKAGSVPGTPDPHYDFLIPAAEGQRFWVMLWYDDDNFVNDEVTLTIARMTLAPAAKETATSLPGTPSVEIRQTIDNDGWWRWRAPLAGTWRIRRLFSNAYGNTIAMVLRADGASAGDPTHSFAVSAGEEIFIHSNGTGIGVTELMLEPFTPLQNFTPATAQPLLPDTMGAGFSFEVLHDPPVSIPSQLAWFSWTAPRDGVTGFRPDNPYTDFTVYRDEAGALTEIGFVGNNGFGAVYVPVAAGQRFLMSLRLWNGAAPVIRADFLPAVRGSDSFAGAPELGTALPLSVQDILSDATAEPGEPGLLSAPERTRWWTFTPAASGVFRLGGRRLNLYTGNTLDSLQQVAAQNPGTSSPQYFFTWFQAQAGTPYHLQVFDDHDYSGLVPFIIAEEPDTGHDLFANAAVIPSWFTYSDGAAASLAFAAAEPGEPPAVPGTPATRTVWMRWTAGFSGRVMLMSWAGPSGASTDPASRADLAVWKGESLTTLERVPSPSVPWFGLPTPYFDAVAGSHYFFQADTGKGISAFYLSLTRSPGDSGASDSFASPLQVNDLTGPGDSCTNHRATFEAGESTAGLPLPPAGFTSGSYWSVWTAPHAGVWRFGMPGGGFPYQAQAFTLYRGPLSNDQRISVLDPAHPGPLYVSVSGGESISIGMIVFQSQDEPEFHVYFPALNINDAVPGIALARWYGLPSPANPDASYSSDGIPLLLKHALGLDPLRNSLPGGNDPNASNWPLPTLTAAGETSFTFRSAPPFQLGHGVDLSGEISRDLVTWLPAPETSAAGQRTVYIPAEGSAGFLRLKASFR